MNWLCYGFMAVGGYGNGMGVCYCTGFVGLGTGIGNWDWDWDRGDIYTVWSYIWMGGDVGNVRGGFI